MKIRNYINNPRFYFIKLKDVIFKLCIRLFLKSKNVNCQLCGWSGYKFYKKKCPKCNSLPRTRLVPFAKHFFNLNTTNKFLLHISPNINEYLFFKDVVGDMKIYDRLDIRADAFFINIVQDLTNTSIKDDAYHLIIAWHVLEHIPDDVDAISEVYRILKKGGRFLVSVPINPINNPKTYEDKTIPYKDFEKVHGHFDHCRSCGLDYFNRFEDCGFTTEELKVETLDYKTISYYGLNKGHVVWCFSK